LLVKKLGGKRLRDQLLKGQVPSSIPLGDKCFCVSISQVP
jgi:hypothetical protein